MIPLDATRRRSRALLLAASAFFMLSHAASAEAIASDGRPMPCYVTPTPRAVAEAAMGQPGQFGSAVALLMDPATGDALCAVGAPSAMSAGSPRGSVRLMALDGRGGSLRPCSRLGHSSLSPRGLTAHARFGAALDFVADDSGDLLAVGAPGAHSQGGARAGLVRLYRVGPPAEPGLIPLLERMEFSPEADTAGAAFGASVAFHPDGQRLAVGAPFRAAPGGPSLAGAVYVYGAEQGEWSLLFVLEAPQPTVAATFGHALEWAADVLVVGAPGDGQVAPGAGRVYGFSGAGPDAGTLRWEVAAAPTSAGGAAGTRFGESVQAIDPSTLAISGWGRGVVEVLSLAAGREPNHLALLHGSAADGFGLRLSAAPDRLFVGAPFASGPGGESSAGRVDAFRRTGDAWVLDASYVSAQPSAGGEFGMALDACVGGMSRSGGAPGVHVLVGEPASSVACTGASPCAAGAAFLY